MDQLNSTAKRLLQKKYNPQTSALDLTAILLLVVLCASWGLQQITIKVANSGVSPVFQAAIRSWGAALLVFLWMLFRGQKDNGQRRHPRMGPSHRPDFFH